MYTTDMPVVILLGAPLVAAVLSLMTTHARLLHGINFTTMIGMVVSEIVGSAAELVHDQLSRLMRRQRHHVGVEVGDDPE